MYKMSISKKYFSDLAQPDPTSIVYAERLRLAVIVIAACVLAVGFPGIGMHGRTQEGFYRGIEGLVRAETREHPTSAAARLNPFLPLCVSDPVAEDSSDFTSSLQVGDILLFRAVGNHFVNSLISEFTRSPYIHVSLYLGGGIHASAVPVGVSYRRIPANAFIDVLRVRGGLSADQRNALRAASAQTRGRAYNFLALFGFPYLVPTSSRDHRSFICSEHTSYVFRQAGIDIAPASADPGLPLAPADIAHAENLEWIGSWYRGSRVADTRLNIVHRLQGRQSSLARAVIRMVGNPFSRRDDHYDSLQQVALVGSQSEDFTAEEEI